MRLALAYRSVLYMQSLVQPRSIDTAMAVGAILVLKTGCAGFAHSAMSPSGQAPRQALVWLNLSVRSLVTLFSQQMTDRNGQAAAGYQR